MAGNYKCRIETVQCAICGNLKREANHWPMVAVYAGETDHDRIAITLIAKESHLPDSHELPDIYEVCGSACEQKLIAQLRGGK